MIKNLRSKSLLIILCAFFSTPVKSSDFIDAINTFATITRSVKDTMQNIDYISNLRAGTIEDFFDNANTLTWDLFIPLYIAYQSANATARSANHHNCSTTNIILLSTAGGVIGGGTAYVLGSIPKNVLKKIGQFFASQKESLEESMN